MTVYDRCMCELVSDKGFYVGDITNVLDSILFEEYCGDEEYDNGICVVDDLDSSFFVLQVDSGTYYDCNGKEYIVTNGNIGVVPFELIEHEIDGGHYFKCAGPVEVSATSDVVNIVFSNGNDIRISLDDSFEEGSVGDFERNYETTDSDELGLGFSYVDCEEEYY